MNEPDLSGMSKVDIPWIPSQLLLAVGSVLTSLLLASSALAFSDQNAQCQVQSRDQRERQEHEAQQPQQPQQRVATGASQRVTAKKEAAVKTSSSASQNLALAQSVPPGVPR